MLLKALIISAFPDPTSHAAITYTCSSSTDCPNDSGCRDSYGHIVYIPETHNGPMDVGGHHGNCGEGPGPNEICTSTSKCPHGYECYREMSGMCCPPKRCVTEEYAEERRAYWANCHPPTCYFPP